MGGGDITVSHTHSGEYGIPNEKEHTNSSQVKFCHECNETKLWYTKSLFVTGRSSNRFVEDGGGEGKGIDFLKVP